MSALHAGALRRRSAALAPLAGTGPGARPRARGRAPRAPLAAAAAAAAPRRRQRRRAAQACAAASAAAPSTDDVEGGRLIGEGVAGFAKFRRAFWKFVRPHTIRGTILGSGAVTLRAVLENPAALADVSSLLPRAALGVLCLLCGNGYIVGINQIYDVEVDKVNKPFLPVAAGELSKGAAWALCVALAAGGLALAATQFGPEITRLYAFGLALGTVYSVPPFHFKRFPVLAFMIIATVRGFLLNFGVYSAARAAMGLSFQWSPTITFSTCFVTCFATIIAISKDLPDIEGDRLEGIKTFAVQLGAARLSYVAAGMLLALYGTAAALPYAMGASVFHGWMTTFHLAVAGLIAAATANLATAKWSQPAIKRFYAFVWSIFYAEYFALPFFAPL